MSDWNEENGRLPGDEVPPAEEQPQENIPAAEEQPQEDIPASEEPAEEGNAELHNEEKAETGEAPADGPAPEEQPQETGPEPEIPQNGITPPPPPTAPENGNIWAYSWDGKQQSVQKKGKGSKAFLIIAAICLILCLAVCIPTILYSVRMATQNTETSSDPRTSVPPESSREPEASEAQQEESQPAYEVSETVKPSAEKYVESSELTDLWDKCSPSCVTIYVTTGGAYGSAYIGSGFVLTEDGYIATNQHVVSGGKTFTVTFYDGTEYSAELVGEDSVRDLAVLKIKANGLKVLEIGDSSSLRPGQSVIAIGTPYHTKLAGTITRGIVSGVNREMAITDDYGREIKTMTLIQTDASINPGNSGGPLINMAGQVIGINFLKLADEYEALGFAIPINYAVQIFNQLIQYGKVVQDPDDDFVASRARIGITVSSVENGLANSGIRPKADYPKEGAFVLEVDPTCDVYAAGLRPYDIIVSFAGKEIKSSQDLTNELKNHKAGETVSMRYFTFSGTFASGEYREVTFKLSSVE